MTAIGNVIEIWRYPTSSIGGELIAQARLTPAGVHNDRRYALIDAATGMPAAPERELRWRPALNIISTTPPGDVPVLHFPDGLVLPLDDLQINQHLSGYFGFPVMVAVHEPYGQYPVTRPRYLHAPVHLVTTASLQHMAALRNGEPLDSRRFRPNFVVRNADDRGFAEDAWTGARFRLGEVVLEVKEQTKRCGVTFIAQPGLPEDPDILRSIVRNNKRHFGVYATVERAGTVRLGDDLVREG